MIITLTIYLLIIGYIILKAFYTSTSIKFSNNNQHIEKFRDSINYISMPFYINMPKIYLLCIFINLILISLIFLPNLLNDLILLIYNSNIAYCQDHDEEYIQTNNTFFVSRRIFDESTIINETYEISDTNRPFIYHLNYKYMGIQDHLKIFQGLSQNFDDIFNKQNALLLNISSIDRNSHTLSEIYKEIYQKSVNTLSLTSNAYKNIMFSYENYEKNNPPKILHDKLLQLDEAGKIHINKIIRDFIDYYQIENLNKKATNIFNALEESQRISKENYDILKQINQVNPGTIIDHNIPLIKVINIPEEIKNYNELLNDCNEKLLLTLNKDLLRNEVNVILYGLEKNDSMDIHQSINRDHNSLLINQDKANIIIDKGFFFKEKLQTDRYYEPFNKDSMNENMLEKYERFIDEKEFIEEEIEAFQREAEEEGF